MALSRRALAQMLGAGALGAVVPVVTRGAPAGAVPATDAAPPTYTDTPTAVTVGNGRLVFVVSKTLGRISSIKLDGRELVHGGMGYYDLNTDAGIFTVGRSDPDHTSYTVSAAADHVDVTVVHMGSTAMPFTVRHHYVLRAGETGIHMATEFGWTPDLPPATLVQTRFVLRGDPAIFTHHCVEEDPFGVRWRAATSLMPTPQEIAACLADPALTLQDTTYAVGALGSAYGRPVYTKYDWSVYQQDHVLHGMAGDGVSAWVVAPRREGNNGGPLRQELTTHQTETTPVLLNCHVSNHYGAKMPQPTAAWSHLYGPWFLYFTTGADVAGMRADAARYADPAVHRDFYDSLGLPGYVPSDQRGSVTGRLVLRDAGPTAGAAGGGPAGGGGAVVVLTEPGQDFQRTCLGYQYWAHVREDGGFALTGVRPGSYRLSAFRPGVAGTFVYEPVQVPAAGTVRLPVLAWHPPRLGCTVWQLGTFDRTSREYRNGAEFRNYGLFARFPQQFPQGVEYVVGHGTVKDWNYVQYQVLYGAAQAPWRIRFRLDGRPSSGLDGLSGGSDGRLPGARTAYLTVALAAWSLDGPVSVPGADGNLTLTVNGTNRLVWTVPHEDTGPATYRSGCSGFHLTHVYEFPVAWLAPGADNVFELQINRDSPLTNQVAYDALRLELA